MADQSLVSAYATLYFDGAKISDLGARAASMPPLEAIKESIAASFGSVTSFMHLFFVEYPAEIPVAVEKVKEIDMRDVMVCAATLFDLGSKFEQFKMSLLTLRFCSGLLTGPLRVFETLAAFDQA